MGTQLSFLNTFQTRLAVNYSCCGITALTGIFFSVPSTPIVQCIYDAIDQSQESTIISFDSSKLLKLTIIPNATCYKIYFNFKSWASHPFPFFCEDLAKQWPKQPMQYIACFTFLSLGLHSPGNKPLNKWQSCCLYLRAGMQTHCPSFDKGSASASCFFLQACQAVCPFTDSSKGKGKLRRKFPQNIQ